MGRKEWDSGSVGEVSLFIVFSYRPNSSNGFFLGQLRIFENCSKLSKNVICQEFTLSDTERRSKANITYLSILLDQSRF